MDEQLRWPMPFNNDAGNEMVYRTFALGGRLYAVGFEKVNSRADFTFKGGDILKVHPAFQCSRHGLWAIIFDEIDPESIDFKGFSHILHAGLSGGRVLFKVACIILEHYDVARPGGYVFSAATDSQHSRQTDLAELYCRALGLDGYPKSRLFTTLFQGWQAFSNSATGGRDYVVTTHYTTPTYVDL